MRKLFTYAIARTLNLFISRVTSDTNMNVANKVKASLIILVLSDFKMRTTIN
jgi:hypothetical protein